MVELSLFNSILHGSLRPWKLDTSNTKYYSRMVSNSSFTALKGGITQFEKELIEIANEHKFNISKVENLQIYFDNAQQDSLAEIDSPLIIMVETQPTNVIARFYFYLIKNEVTRLTNTMFQVLTKEMDESHKRALPYHFHTRIVDLLKDIPKTQDLISPEDKLSIFVIESLKIQIIRLLFETEHLYKHLFEQEISDKYQIFGDYLNQEISEDDFYKESERLKYFRGLIKGDKIRENTNSLTSASLSFGFKGDKDKLRIVLKQLQLQINLLKKENEIEQLLDILTDPESVLENHKIVYLNCETKQFRYIVDKLSIYFSNLKVSSIERSKLFYSSNNTILSAQLLSSSKSERLNGKATIDKICKHLQ